MMCVVRIHAPRKHRYVNPPSSSASRAASAGRIVASLRALRARLRALLVVGRLVTLLAGVVAVAIALAVTDYLLRLPEWIRWLHWSAGIAAIILFLIRYVGPAWRYKPSLTDLALRIERERPELAGLAASAVDFAHEAPADHVSNQPRSDIAGGLADAVCDHAARRWSGSSLAGLLNPRTLKRGAASLAGAIAIALILLAASPRLWTIGAVRLAAPWAGVAWPKRTGVVDMTEGAVHALHTALPLRAAVIKSNRTWDETYVAVRYRLIAEGDTGPERRELLTWQQRDVETPYAETGALFERLIEPSADAVEFRFETDDDATDWRTITLVPPPAIEAAQAIITPPEYARKLLAQNERADAPPEPVRAMLGDGTDERAAAPPSLAGSTIELTITLNKPVEMPEEVAQAFIDPEQPDDAPGRARIERTASTWKITWTLAESLRLPIRLRDEHGIESVDEAVFRFEALADRSADATVTEPSTDRTVLATALLPVAGEGRDDVGLAWVALEQTIWTPAGAPAAPSGPGGALEQKGEPITIARTESVGITLARTSAELDLAPLALKPGDEVRLAALAIDVRAAETEGAAPTRSTVRTLRIISDAQFVEEVQRSLAEVRQTAIRTEQQQAEARGLTLRGAATDALRRSQASITERLARQSEVLDQLIERVEQNRVNDRGLEGLLEQARTGINDAGNASSRASAALEQAADSPSTPNTPAPAPQRPPTEPSSEPSSPSGASPANPGANADSESPAPSGAPSPEAGSEAPPQEAANQPGAPQQAPDTAGPAAAPQPPSSAPAPGESPSAPREESPIDEPQRQAADAQQEVQDTLRNVIELLDRGEDTWLARTTIERLAQQQAELRERTTRLGRSTAGKTTEQLTPQERTELDEIVEAQSQLADETTDLTRDLREREKSLREKDPAAAAGVAQAARRAEQQQVAQTMRNAASEASQNQTSRAGRQQQQAQENLEEMLRDLDRANEARDEVLRRELASIIESLEGLIKQQESELAALDEATRARRGLTGLDAGMIRLNTNTLGALDQAKAAGADVAPIATLISRASDAQTGAITEIRRPIVGETMVREFESRSLALLKQALQKAKEIESAASDRARRQRLNELKKSYRVIIEQQTAIRDETAPLAQAAELTRRDRQIALGLSERQRAIGDELRAVLTATSELQEARVFDFAHVRMDALVRAADENLAQAKPAPALREQNAVLRLLTQVLESLEDPKPDEKKFAEGEQQGGGGGGGASGEQPLIPPLKELMLLRRLQTDLAEETREAAQQDAPPARERLEALGTAQRDLSQVGKEFVDRLKKRDQPQEAPELKPPAPDAPGPPEPQP